MWLREGVFSLFAMLCVLDGAQADITITQLANEGAIISDGENRVMIDGMVVEPYSVYGGLPADAAALFKQVNGPYSDIDLALASHRHHDHNQPFFACEFVKNSADTLFVSSAQVLGLMREKCRDLVTTSSRIREINPQYGAPQVFEEDGIKVTAFPLSHGTRKYAKIQNFGHLIEIGGLTILHIGDAAVSPEDFQTAGLDQIKVDVALLPFWFYREGPGSAIIQQYMDAPVKIAVHIPPGEMAEIQAYLSETFPDVKVLDSPLKELRVSSAGR